ncbi:MULTISPECIES: SH3 domain-containing protein [Pannonibacter]|uniref:Aspartyl-trna synthetase n=1 Tax=Pannonibacter phragmitetus TaxID=121719 RepID=A0A0U3MRE1_9HYPH|nr:MULTISPECIES: SH3 domain-containing protein [Pannonibacter]ALV26775.1 aspartyl-trna synthetase [Pannonibacter phragmitetus]
MTRFDQTLSGTIARKFRLLAAAAAALVLVAPQVLAQTAQTGSTGLPLPRFVSIKSDRANVRMGPSREHEVSWTYVQGGLPVEITQEFENWRRVRDWEGKEGWLFHTLLSSRRTALVTPWEQSENTPLHVEPRPEAAIRAYLAPKVLTDIKSCNGTWCRVQGRGYDGWVEQVRLFGVYPNEKISN